MNAKDRKSGSTPTEDVSSTADVVSEDPAPVTGEPKRFNASAEKVGRADPLDLHLHLDRDKDQDRDRDQDQEPELSSPDATPRDQLQPNRTKAVRIETATASEVANAAPSDDAPTAPVGMASELSPSSLARRDFETALAARSPVGGDQGPRLHMQAVQNELTYTTPPSLTDRLVVLGLRVLRAVSDVIGVNLFVQIGAATASDRPPHLLTIGLNAKQTEYEVSPGNTWQAWEIEPPAPTGKTVIAIHGGGWTLQPTLLHWFDYTDMARDTGATVVVPMYPLALTEAGAATNVIPGMADFISHEIELRGASNVSIHADSAGPSIALGAVRELILRGDPVPASMVLLSFAPDMSNSNPDIHTIDDPLFTPGSVDFGYWLDGIADLKDPRISPLFVETEVLRALPPTTIYIGSLELTLPDNLLLYQRAVEEDAPISVVVGQGQIHTWALGGPPIPINSQTNVVRPDIYRQLGLLPTPSEERPAISKKPSGRVRLPRSSQ